MWAVEHGLEQVCIPTLLGSFVILFYIYLHVMVIYLFTLFTCFVGQTMMKKAMILCFVLLAVISVTTAAQCTQQQAALVCRDNFDRKLFHSGQNWVNSKCQFCKCDPGAMTCCMGTRDAAGKCKKLE
ncbi:hypothetical protein Q7C36_012285 [Tachysurus vachellii]|uniref:Uncharacterized protein n=1 Tax=Tachysurus vachellii TaxID=175792 RepID=A0AA88SLG0_TACVA|nr:hypothetical protein Q7C36_012285 [Tachysurus vachellii]